MATARTAPVISSELVSSRTWRAVSKTGSISAGRILATSRKNGRPSSMRTIKKAPLAVLEIILASSSGVGS